jgi:signal transduction histidine kinase
VTILLYTDISSAVAFKDGMNQRLGLLLIFSGVLSLGISIVMSKRFKQAILKLSRHAESIGHGNFNDTAGVFKYTEFSELSKSMDNMSNMLHAYESRQKQFFQNVSHELRTPLMSIQGYAEGILADIFNKDEAAGIILSEGHKMTELVSSLLYLSRIDEGMDAPLNISSIDVKNLLSTCYERVKPIAAKSEKQIKTDSQESIILDTDEEKLERAVINILSNAIRHGSSVVRISYRATGTDVEIKIQDDGKGIDKSDLPHIFERFYKGENGNSGLGLAISNDIIKSLGGRLRAENLPYPESGAVFTINLPMKGRL